MRALPDGYEFEASHFEEHGINPDDRLFLVRVSRNGELFEQELREAGRRCLHEKRRFPP